MCPFSPRTTNNPQLSHASLTNMRLSAESAPFFLVLDLSEATASGFLQCNHNFQCSLRPQKSEFASLFSG
jgi:hypothetical protein